MRSLFLGWLGLGIFFTFLVSCPHVGQAANQTFKDWEVGCDNTNACVAFGFSASGDGEGYVRISRAAGAGHAPDVQLALFYGDEKASGDISVTVDGKAVAGVGAVKTETTGDEPYLQGHVSSASVHAFIAALHKGHRLRLQTADGKIANDISLNGVSAALLKMDDVQGRVGTVSALIKRGDKPEESVPAPLPVPVIAAVKPQGKVDVQLATELRAYLAAKDPAAAEACDDLTDDNQLKEQDIVEALTTSMALVGIDCANGAYNERIQFWTVPVADVSKARPVVFKEENGKPRGKDDAYATNEVVNPTFDNKTGMLETSDLGRGIGDCGAVASYVWTGQNFTLTHAAFMGTCKGAMQDTWPVLWRADVR